MAARVENRLPRSALWVALLVIVGAEVGHWLSFRDLPFATFWPPAGVLVYALAIHERRDWKRLAVAAALANVASNLAHGQPPALAMGYAVVNLVAAFIGRAILGEMPSASTSDRQLDMPASRLIVTAIVQSTISAALGAGLIALFEGFDEVRTQWTFWFAADATGMLVTVPVLHFTRWRLRHLFAIGRRPLELVAYWLSFGLAVVALFEVAPESVVRLFSFGFLLFPFLVWAGTRFDGETMAVSIFFVAIVSIFAGTHGQGPFARAGLSPSEISINTQLYVTTLVLSGWSLATAVAKLEHSRAAAVEASATKSRFLAAMSHEIRTPLASIVGFGELLRDEARTDEEKRKCADTIVRAGRHLSHVVDDVLDYSKVEAGKLSIERLPIDPKELLSDVEDLMRPTAERKGVALRIISEDLPARIETDPTRLKQVLLNAVGNALKFTATGEVSVRAGVERKDERWRLVVRIRDTGIGISDADAKKLFQLFSQADMSTTRRYGGTGLGLILSRQIARALGGDFMLEHSEPGAGSTFLLTIDAGPASSMAAAAQEETVDGPAARLDGKRILLAEDAKDLQLLMSASLEASGAEVTCSDDGVEAIAAAGRSAFDAVLMDVQMPRMDGVEAARRLRDSGYDAPILALTAQSPLTLAPELARSFTGIITKPVPLKDLSARVAAAIRNSSGRRRAYESP